MKDRREAERGTTEITTGERTESTEGESVKGVEGVEGAGIEGEGVAGTAGEERAGVGVAGEEGVEKEEPREVAVRYYICARPECRFRTESEKEADRHEHMRKGHYCELQYIIKSRIRLP